MRALRFPRNDKQDKQDAPSFLDDIEALLRTDVAMPAGEDSPASLSVT